MQWGCYNNNRLAASPADWRALRQPWEPADPMNSKPLQGAAEDRARVEGAAIVSGVKRDG